MALARSHRGALRDLLRAPGCDRIAANGILELYRTDAGEALALLRGAGFVANFSILAAACLRQQSAPAGGVGPIPEPPLSIALDLADSLQAPDFDPRIRAVALSFSICRDPDRGVKSFEPERLNAAYERDPHPMVRRAALRLAGALGPRRGSLDLTRALLAEEDAVLLAAAIEGRTLWAEGSWGVDVEVLDGVVCWWLPKPAEGYSKTKKPWLPEELARIEGLLATRRESELRDACSLTLAGRHRDAIESAGADPEAAPILGYRVAEWSVWRDGGGTEMDLSEALVDQPATLVHPNFRRYGANGSFPLVISKAVVFFYAPRPLVAWFQAATASAEGEGPSPKGERFEWLGLRVGYPEAIEGPEAEVDSEHWWSRCRAVGASRLSLGNASERFVFYSGGLGDFGPVALQRSGGRTESFFVGARALDGAAMLAQRPLPLVLLMRRGAGAPARGAAIVDLAPREAARRIGVDGLDLDEDSLAAELDAGLRREGLNEAEARSLIATWKGAFFEQPGLRVISVLARPACDALVPARTFPTPETWVRVAVVFRDLGAVETDGGF
jgi:hypothetical protein